MPDEHRKRLSEELGGHEARLDSLRQVIEAMQDEAEMHETLLRLGSDEKVLATFDEAYDHPHVAREAADNPGGFASARGIDLPPDAAINVISTDPESPVVEVVFRGRRLEHKVIWSRTDGFSTETVGDTRDAPPEASRD